MISPVRSGWPTMLPRTQNRSPMAACISPLPHPRCPRHPCTAATRSPVCHITMASIHLTPWAAAGHVRAQSAGGQGWVAVGASARFIVVGGGLVAASVAYHLARRGASVIIVAGGQQGAATSAGAGIICPWTASADDACYRLCAA